jgi:transcriptional regulator with XRE-family HTH domain
VTVEDSVLVDTAGDGRGDAPASARARSSGSVEALTNAVAQHVRTLRTGRGWSLDELAGRSAVSKGMIVQIEAARTNPSVGTLCRLADAFGVAVTALLESADERPVRVSRAADAPILWRGARGGIARLLGGLKGPDFVELWEWVLEPADRHGSDDHPAGTRELLHVTAGELTVAIGGVAHRVGAGDTLDFAADIAHEYRNDGDAAARVVMVVVTPAGEVDRRR